MNMKRLFGLLTVLFCIATLLHAQTETQFYNEGYRHQQAGRLQDAILSYKKAIGLNNDNGDAHYQLGRVYYLLASEKNENMSNGQTTTESGHPTQAYIQKWEKGTDELALAIKEFEEVARIEPMAADAIFMLGLLNHNLGLYDAAIGWHRKAVAVSPGSPDAQDARHDMALIHFFIKKDTTAAIALLKDCLEINPDHLPSIKLMRQIQQE